MSRCFFFIIIISYLSSTRQRQDRVTRSFLWHVHLIIIAVVQRFLLLYAHVYWIYIIILSCRDRIRQGRRRVSGLRYSCTGVFVYTSISRSGRWTKDLVYILYCLTTTTTTTVQSCLQYCVQGDSTIVLIHIFPYDDE